MTPITIVKNLDVFKNIQAGLISGSVVAVKGQFSFERAEETFHRRVVIAVTLATHATDHLELCQQRLILIAGILAASIRVVQSSR